jgi:hypothetical protein
VPRGAGVTAPRGAGWRLLADLHAGSGPLERSANDLEQGPELSQERSVLAVDGQDRALERLSGRPYDVGRPFQRQHLAAHLLLGARQLQIMLDLEDAALILQLPHR